MNPLPKWYAKSMLYVLQGEDHHKLQDSWRKRKSLFPLPTMNLSAEATHRKYQLIRVVGIRQRLWAFLKTDNYQIIPNRQEPIISEEQWLRVQELRKHRRRPTATGRTNLFSGLVFCPDCGAKLHFCAAKSLKRNQEFWRCSNYKDGRGTCQIHYIRDIVLERIVLEAISSLADFVKCHEAVFLYMLAKKTNAIQQKEYKRLEQSVEQSSKRIAEIDRLIEKVFEQNASGHCCVKVDIYFAAVGMIDIPTENEILATMEEIRENPQNFRFVA